MRKLATFIDNQVIAEGSYTTVIRSLYFSCWFDKRQLTLKILKLPLSIREGRDTAATLKYLQNDANKELDGTKGCHKHKDDVIQAKPS